MTPLAEETEQRWHLWATVELGYLPRVGVRSKGTISCLFDSIRCLGFLSGVVMETNKQ